jgi:hypothetical protein
MINIARTAANMITFIGVYRIFKILASGILSIDVRVLWPNGVIADKIFKTLFVLFSNLERREISFGEAALVLFF